MASGKPFILVIATTLAYFLSPLANGRRVDPEYWSDPDQGPQLTRTLEETQGSLANLRTETQSSLANLSTETRSLNNSLQAERSSMRSWCRQQVAGQRRGIWTRLLDRFRSERTILSESGLVDAEWYLRNYPDVVEAPIDQYIRVGTREGRDPNPFFSSRTYLKLNPDVAISGMNPLVHFVRYGAAEGRRFSE
jgi:hypothetical protein